MFYKIGWIIRRILYALAFKKISFFGYLGRPIVIIRPSRLTLEARTRIFPGCRFEMYTGNGRIIVKKNCSIGQNFHCTAMGELVIGEDTLITSNVCITDIDHDYSLLKIPILEQEYIHKRTQIGANCFIGFGAVVQAGSILGDNCIVGANSVVRGIFPANSVIAGVPARVVKTFDGDKQLWEKVNREVSK